MSYLNKNEQIRIDSVEQLKQVYEMLKDEWDKDYTVYEEIDYFHQNTPMRYVYWDDDTVALSEKNDTQYTITFEQFINRVNPKPETTIIESVDGKKYEVIMVREVVEPLMFHKWFRKVWPNFNYIDFAHSDCGNQSKIIEEYVNYRKSLEQ